MYAKTLPRTIGAAPSSEGLDLHRSLRDGIQTPLSALQATLEALALETPESDPRCGVLHNAARSVERISRRAQTLADYTLETAPVPMHCSLGELARGAHGATPSELRRSVRLAVEDPHERMFVDGPLCSRLLSYLLHACAEFRDEALFHVCREDDLALFTVVCVPVPAGAARACPRALDAREHVNDLMLLVAERELARMGGRIEHVRSTTGAQRVSVRLPLDRDGETQQ